VTDEEVLDDLCADPARTHPDPDNGICGRPARKSETTAFVAIYLACFKRYALSPGHKQVGMLLAVDRRQRGRVSRRRSRPGTGRTSPNIVPINANPGGGGVPSSTKMIVPTASVPGSPCGPRSPTGPCSPCGPIGPCEPVGPGGPAAVGSWTPIVTVSEDASPHWSVTVNANR
jgi:hypothetical protein